MVMAPVVRGRKGEYGKLLEQMRLEGYSRVKVNGELRRLDEEIVLDKKFKHDISVVVDRLVMKTDLRRRLSESVEAAAGLAAGLIEVEIVDDQKAEPLLFSEQFACLNCGTSIPELEPRIFSFNSPHGACERCHGLGFQRVIDPELVVPDPTLSLAEGALQPWNRGITAYWRRLIAAVAEEYGVDADKPWSKLKKSEKEIFLYGTGEDRHQVTYTNRFGRRRSYKVRFEGIVNNLQRRYEETDSETNRERIESYMAEQPCPQCEGARLRPESLAVKVGGISIAEYSDLSARAAAEWIADAGDDRDRAGDRAADRARDHRTARLPRERRHRLPLAGPLGPLALRRRGAADPPRDPDRLAPGRGHVRARRALDRPPPARQREADRDPRPPARPRQHGDRGRARRGHDDGRRPPGRPRPRRRRTRRPRDRRRHPGARSPRTRPR